MEILLGLENQEEYFKLLRDSTAAFGNNNLTEAVSLLRKAIKLNPYDSQPVIKLANYLFKSGKQNEAISELQCLIKILELVNKFSHHGIVYGKISEFNLKQKDFKSFAYNRPISLYFSLRNSIDIPGSKDVITSYYNYDIPECFIVKEFKKDILILELFQEVKERFMVFFLSIKDEVYEASQIYEKSYDYDNYLKNRTFIRIMSKLNTDFFNSYFTINISPLF